MIEQQAPAQTRARPLSASSPQVTELAGEVRVALGQLVRKLREQSEGNDLTTSQQSVLGRLERDGPATATQLANAEGVRPQSMAKIVRVLEDAGLIGGAPDPNDGRKIVISVTETAVEQFRTGRRAREDWLARAIAANLSPDELDQLSSMPHLVRRLTQWQP
ncbi:MAG: MarR family winged helix-turn-helix transcriptional regulator [Actinocrinis sp.]